MPDTDLTIAILRDIQSRLSSLEAITQNNVAALEITNERLSLVERGVTFCAAQINVMRRHKGIEDRKTGDDIQDLQARVAKLEDLVKP